MSIQQMARIFLFFIFCYAGLVHAMPDWHWESDFSQSEAAGLKAWIEHVESGLITLFGSLPYSYSVYFHRHAKSYEPVPWANTEKRGERAVHFYVDTSHSWQSFMRDWTAPHELTHLMFPYLGDEGRWFAEGISSYLQYQIMYANNTISWSKGTAKLNERFQRARARRGLNDISIADLSLIVGQTGAYVRLYWGGAAYFMHADQRLYEEKGTRLSDIIKQYIHCCYSARGTSVKKMMRMLDSISESKIFTETYTDTVAQPVFPETRKALAWLSKHPPTLH